MLIILARQAFKAMALAWALLVVTLAVPAPGWVGGTSEALFAASCWLLALGGAWELRERQEARRERIRAGQEDIALARRPGASHCHEVSAGSWHGYLMSYGYQGTRVLGQHAIIIPEGAPCAICEQLVIDPGDPALDGLRARSTRAAGRPCTKSLRDSPRWPGL